MASPPALVELRAARMHPVVVLVSTVDRRILPALRFVSRLPFAQPIALHVSVDAEETRALAKQWMALELTWLPLHICEARGAAAIADAVAAAIDKEAVDGDAVTVVVPELNVPRWWHSLLHRQSARRIAADLQARSQATTVIVPFSLT